MIKLFYDSGIEFPFTKRTFPAGETHVNVNGLPTTNEYNVHIIHDKGNVNSDIIDSLLLLNAIRNINSVARIVLTLPYLPYSRQDRACFRGDANSLKVIENILLSLFDQVETFDVHNLDKFNGNNIRPTYLLQTLFQIYKDDYDFIVCPDKGAQSKFIAYDIENTLEKPVIYCNKNRDPETGKLSGFSIENKGYLLPEYKHGLIIDDICDGGGTFKGLSGLFKCKLDLYVSHGIFSKGISNIEDSFDKIITTNTVCPFKSDRKLLVFDWETNKIII